MLRTTLIKQYCLLSATVHNRSAHFFLSSPNIQESVKCLKTVRVKIILID